MSNITITSMTSEHGVTASDIIQEIKSEMNTIVSKTSRIARLVGTYVGQGYEQKELVSETGLSKATISKMNKASEGYAVLSFIFADSSNDELCRLLDVPYTFIYNHITDITDGTISEMTVDEAIDFLTRKKIEVNQEVVEGEEVVDEDCENETEADNNDFVNIRVYKENALWLAEQIEYWASDLESSDAMSKVVYDLIKQLKKGGK